MKPWNGEFRSLLVTEEGNPELYEELARYSHRDRTNRLRTLALIGLFALQTRGGSAGLSPIQIPNTQVVDEPKQPSSETKKGLDPKRQDLRDRMLGSI